MWTCPYCGNKNGMIFEDQQMSGMLCLHPECGRVEELNRDALRADREEWADSDM